MSEAAPTFLLFSIAGGYAFLQLWPRAKHRWDALEWERNLFEATFVGSIFFVFARVIVLLLERSDLLRPALDLFKAGLPFPYSGSLVATLGLGATAGLLLKRFSSEEEGIHDAVAGYGGELLKLLLDAFESRFPVSITLKNGKVYVGLVIACPSLSTNSLYTKLLPSISGYRDEQHQIRFTTSYWHAYSDLERRIHAGEETNVDPESFGIVLPLGEIMSVNFFDEDSYTRYFSSGLPGRSSPPPAEESTPRPA